MVQGQQERPEAADDHSERGRRAERLLAFGHYLGGPNRQVHGSHGKTFRHVPDDLARAGLDEHALRRPGLQAVSDGVPRQVGVKRPKLRLQPAALHDYLRIERLEPRRAVYLEDRDRERLLDRVGNPVGHPDRDLIPSAALRLARPPGEPTGHGVNLCTVRRALGEAESQVVFRPVVVGGRDRKIQQLALVDPAVVDLLQHRRLVQLQNRHVEDVAAGGSRGIGHRDSHPIHAGPLLFAGRPGKHAGIRIDDGSGRCPFETPDQRPVGVRGPRGKRQERALGHFLVGDGLEFGGFFDDDVEELIGEVAGQVGCADGHRMGAALAVAGRPGDFPGQQVDHHACRRSDQPVAHPAVGLLVRLDVVKIRFALAGIGYRVGGNCRRDRVDGDFQRVRDLAEEVDRVVAIADVHLLVAERLHGSDRVDTVGQFDRSVGIQHYRVAGGYSLGDELPVGE